MSRLLRWYPDFLSLCRCIFLMCVYTYLCMCTCTWESTVVQKKQALTKLPEPIIPALPAPSPAFFPHCLVLFCSASQLWICDTLPASASWILELPAWVNMHKQCLDFWYFLLTVTFPFADGLSDENNDDRVLKCCLQYQELFPYSLVILCTWVS